ncbi:MAG: hypothetical protein HOW73_30595 [Polyangiaceae bacterium]|nr:hypothetical protein [Polyangiaceae bacterium]
MSNPDRTRLCSVFLGLGFSAFVLSSAACQGVPSSGLDAVDDEATGGQSAGAAPPEAQPAGGTLYRDGDVIHDCIHGHEISIYENEPAAGTTLRMIGVYQTRTDHDFNHSPEGVANVHIERPGNTILVLSSYEPTFWHVTATPDVTIERVILSGYHAQRADVPEGVPVEAHAYQQDYVADCAIRYPTDPTGCETEKLVTYAEQETGLSVSSFHGCYDMNEIVLLPHGVDG